MPAARAYIDLAVGVVVALVSREGSSNGAGDGILWRVIEVIRGGTPHCGVRVEPCWCATGSTRLRSKLIHWSEVRQVMDFARLGELRMQLDEMCRQALARSANVADDVDGE